MADLRTVVLLDYQNIHLWGAGLFTPSAKRHQTLLDPSKFANELLRSRALARPNDDRAVLSRVEVYRGLPSNRHDPGEYHFATRQQARWGRDPRVSVVQRPLTVRAMTRVTPPHAPAVSVAVKVQQGVDVLLAVALLRAVRQPDVDLVVLASKDSDLRPALDEAIAAGGARVETCSWATERTPAAFKPLRPTFPRSVWNTRLGKSDFVNSIDSTPDSRQRK